MSLEHAILGFLAYKPFTGYDLDATFKVSIQHFWPADRSQIYRTLARMSDEGWVKVEVVEQEDRPDRKLYHITEQGRAELRRWLTAPLVPRPGRSASLIQVFFAGQLPDEEIIKIFEREAEHVRSHLATFDGVPDQSAPYAEMVGSARETYFWMLTLEAGIYSHRAHLAWLESVIERLKAGAHPAA